MRNPEIRSRIRVFSIVEMLVALVVLSVGMLGIAGLFVYAMLSGTSSIYRTQAVNLAADMADRIRANQQGNVAYAAAAADNDCETADCTPAQIAADDLAGWTGQLTAALPAGSGAVAVAGAAAPFTYSITVSWSEPGVTVDQSYTLTVQI